MNTNASPNASRAQFLKKEFRLPSVRTQLACRPAVPLCYTTRRNSSINLPSTAARLTPSSASETNPVASLIMNAGSLLSFQIL